MRIWRATSKLDFRSHDKNAQCSLVAQDWTDLKWIRWFQWFNCYDGGMRQCVSRCSYVRASVHHSPWVWEACIAVHVVICHQMSNIKWSRAEECTSIDIFIGLIERIFWLIICDFVVHSSNSSARALIMLANWWSCGSAFEHWHILMTVKRMGQSWSIWIFQSYQQSIIIQTLLACMCSDGSTI
jgi:hypothetical protein